MVKIYILVDPNGVPRYVGKTEQTLRLRLNDHVSNYRLKTNTHKNSWIRSLKKKGLKPTIQLLELVSSTEWEFWEQYWISQFKTWGFKLTNGTLGGEGSFGGSGCKGYRHTKEAKEKISKANSRPKSKEWIRNQARARFKPVEAWKDGVLIKTYDSATTAALSMGDINKKKNISACAKGNRNSAYGFVWKFKV